MVCNKIFEFKNLCDSINSERIFMNYIDEINRHKKEKNAIILTHCYQPVEIDEVSDFVGDSFYLSKKAKETNADILFLQACILWHNQQNFLTLIKKYFCQT